MELSINFILTSEKFGSSLSFFISQNNLWIVEVICSFKVYRIPLCHHLGLVFLYGIICWKLSPSFPTMESSLFKLSILNGVCFDKLHCTENKIFHSFQMFLHRLLQSSPLNDFFLSLQQLFPSSLPLFYMFVLCLFSWLGELLICVYQYIDILLFFQRQGHFDSSINSLFTTLIAFLSLLSPVLCFLNLLCEIFIF